MVPAKPAPPATINAPELKLVDGVVAETVNVVSKVLAPVNVCAKVETKPVAPTPAIGILNVCVEPEEDILNPLPEVPVAKYWIPIFKPLRVVKPVAAVGDQVKPVEEVDNAVKT